MAPFLGWFHSLSLDILLHDDFTLMVGRYSTGNRDKSADVVNPVSSLGLVDMTFFLKIFASGVVLVNLNSANL
jgi:hypothetical protein